MSLLFIIGGTTIVATVLLSLWGMFSVTQYLKIVINNPFYLLSLLGVLPVLFGYGEYIMLVTVSMGIGFWFEVLRFIRARARTT